MAEDTLTRIAARADLCRLLAACYYQPGPEFAEEEVFRSLHEAAQNVDAGLADLASALGEAFAAQPLLELQVDHTRLFLNPSGPLAPPYESAWTAENDPFRTQETIDAILATYHDGGHEVDGDFRDLPDHVAAELEFLYTIIYREARGRALGDRMAEQDAVAFRRRYLERHPGQWIAPFTDAVRSGAGTSFYRTLAMLTARFIANEGG